MTICHLKIVDESAVVLCNHMRKHPQQPLEAANYNVTPTLTNLARISKLHVLTSISDARQGTLCAGQSVIQRNVH